MLIYTRDGHMSVQLWFLDLPPRLALRMESIRPAILADERFP